MNRNFAPFLVVGVIGLGISLAFVTRQISPDVKSGSKLYTTFCAVCHGTSLAGQENWRSPNDSGQFPAPPHDRTGHTWHHADDVLFAYVKFGGAAYMQSEGIANFNSGMPGFADQLSDQDINDVLEFIKSTWPERERNIQFSRSKQ